MAAVSMARQQIVVPEQFSDSSRAFPPYRRTHLKSETYRVLSRIASHCLATSAHVETGVSSEEPTAGSLDSRIDRLQSGAGTHKNDALCRPKSINLEDSWNQAGIIFNQKVDGGKSTFVESAMYEGEDRTRSMTVETLPSAQQPWSTLSCQQLQIIEVEHVKDTNVTLTNNNDLLINSSDNILQSNETVNLLDDRASDIQRFQHDAPLFSQPVEEKDTLTLGELPVDSGKKCSTSNHRKMEEGEISDEDEAIGMSTESVPDDTIAPIEEEENNKTKNTADKLTPATLSKTSHLISPTSMDTGVIGCNDGKLVNSNKGVSKKIKQKRKLGACDDLVGSRASAKKLKKACNKKQNGDDSFEKNKKINSKNDDKPICGDPGLEVLKLVGSESNKENKDSRLIEKYVISYPENEITVASPHLPSESQNVDQNAASDPTHLPKPEASSCKKRDPPSEARKAKKKQKKRQKRAEKNRELGVKRLKLRPLQNPKPISYCRHYLQGRCHEGENCKFSHDTVPLTKSKPCGHFARHACLKGDDCPYDHELSKYPCTNFTFTGTCSRGENCLFSHQQKSEAPPALTKTPSKQIPLPTPLPGVAKAHPGNMRISDQATKPMVSCISEHTTREKPKNEHVPPMVVPKGVTFMPPHPKAPTPKGTPATAPKGINFLSVGKPPDINPPASKPPCHGVGPPIPQNSNGLKKSGPELRKGMEPENHKTEPAAVPAKPELSLKEISAQAVPYASSGMGISAQSCYNSTAPASAQRAIVSTLAFASKVGSGMTNKKDQHLINMGKAETQGAGGSSGPDGSGKISKILDFLSDIGVSGSNS